MSDGARWNVGVLIFDGAELLDFAGPVEAFSAVERDGENPFNTVTVAESLESIATPNGLRCLPDHTLADAPKLDVLVVPGGMGTRREIDNENLIAWIRQTAGEAEVVTSVCTGSFLLAKAGLLDGLRVTTHWGSIERLRKSFPAIGEVVENTRFVDEGRIVTAAGVSAGIDMALHVIERLAGREAAASSARLMEYDYWKRPEAVR